MMNSLIRQIGQTAGRFPRLAGLASLGLVVVLVWAVSSHSGQANIEPGRWVVAQKRSFDMFVRERGRVAPARVVEIRSEISSDQAQLQWIHPEGHEVNAGLIIARFDSKPFEDALFKAKQEYADAQARLAAAEKALELQKEEEQGKLEAARHAVELEQLKLDDLQNGSGKLKLRLLKHKVTETARKVKKLTASLADFDLLLEKGHVSRRERDEVEENLIQAQEARELARAELKNYTEYEHKRQLSEATVALQKARSDLERIRKISALEIQRRKEEVIKYQRDLATVKTQLQRAETDLENAVVRAPIDGVLLYAEIPRGAEERKPRIGDNIWYKQTFLKIPDTRSMVVEVDVREVDVAQLRPGAPARIELDALPGQHFSGKLMSVESVARESDSKVRRYRAIIEMTDATDAVNVGMSANVRIRFRRVTDALTVPVAAVDYEDGKPVVRVRRDGETVQAVVRLGAVSSRWAQVLDGIRPGEQVAARAE